MAYATVEDVAAGFRDLSEEESATCEALLDEAQVIIDNAAMEADATVKKVVSCRMVRRAIGSGDISSFPIGATQGSMGALGYTQSFTIGSGGSVGELYLSKADKKLLGINGRIGARSPLESLVEEYD